MSKKQFATILGLSMLSAFIGGGLAVQLLSVPPAFATRQFDFLTIGKGLNVYGWTSLGRSGFEGGKIAFFPPDRSIAFYIDYPGGRRLRFSGGNRPGQFECMSISPGIVRIHGSLQIFG